MRKRVYIETTIPSYLAARPGRDLIQAARQQMTHAWWNDWRQDYDLFISGLVLEEAGQGDVDAVQKRLSILSNLPLLEFTDSANVIAKAILASGVLPQEAARDSVHIAITSIHDIDILLTWNCRHIANAAIVKELRDIVTTCGFELPILCTPEELLGE